MASPEPAPGDGPANLSAGSPPRPRPALLAAIVGIALLGAGLLAWSIATYGPAMGQTGLNNIAAAESLRHGEPLVTSRSDLFTLWPPLMPLLYAAGRELGLSYAAATAALNVAACFALLLAVGLLTRQLGGGFLAVVVAEGSLSASPKLYLALANARTEPLFLALLMLGAAAIVRYSAARRTRWLAVAGGCFALAALQRYVGVAWILVTAAALLLPTARGVALRRRLLAAAGFAFGALLPLCGWALRNLLLAGELSGERPAADASLATNAADAADTLATWLAPTRGPHGLRWVVMGAVALVLVLGLVRLLRVAPSLRDRWALSYAILLPTSYAVFLILYASTVHLDPLGHRLLLPAFPPFCVLLGLAVDSCLRERRRLVRLAGAAALLGAIVVSATAAAETRELALRSRSQGLGGLGAREWRESPLVAALLRAPLEGAVYSNLPELVLYYRDIRAGFLKPSRLKRDLRRSELMDRPGTIVWVANDGIPAMWASGPPHIVLRAEFPDGAIYDTTPPEPAGSETK